MFEAFLTVLTQSLIFVVSNFRKSSKFNSSFKKWSNFFETARNRSPFGTTCLTIIVLLVLARTRLGRFMDQNDNCRTSQGIPTTFQRATTSPSQDIAGQRHSGIVSGAPLFCRSPCRQIAPCQSLVAWALPHPSRPGRRPRR